MTRFAPALLICLLSSALLAEEANLSADAAGPGGAASRLDLAQRAYLVAMRDGDAITLLAAIRLARSVTLRPSTTWALTLSDEPPADQPAGRTAAPDPGSADALAIARNLAAENPDLEDLVYGLDVQTRQTRKMTAVFAEATIAGGRSDLWRMPISGEVSAELLLIGDGDSPIGLIVTDEGGSVVCLRPPSLDPRLCRFTPARNGFFSAKITAYGEVLNSYRLIGN